MIHMQRSNVKMCPHVDSWKNRHDTATGTVFLCDRCQEELEKLLPEKIHRMSGSVYTPKEWANILNERENIRVETKIQEEVSERFMRAGFPRWLALPAPVVM